MKTEKIVAKTKGEDGKEISTDGTVEVYESLTELVQVLTSKDTKKDLKDRLLRDLNRQITTDALNALRVSVKPVTDKTLLLRGLKDGSIPKEDVERILKQYNLK